VSSTHLGLTTRFLLLSDSCALSVERTGLPFTIPAGPLRSRDSSVCIATDYRLDDQRGREFESRYVHKFLFLHVVQTGSGVHPTSYKMGTGGSFPGVKRQGREAEHSPPPSAEVKKMWIYTSTPPHVFMA
jgi:hypothetical protein